MKILSPGQEILTPGLGIPGRVLIDNHGTRLVFLCDHVRESQEDLVRTFQKLSVPQIVNRMVLKAVTSFCLEIGRTIGKTDLRVEACVPFEDRSNRPLYWVVAGLNSGNRIRNPLLQANQKAFMAEMVRNAHYAPQSASQLFEFSMNFLAGIKNLKMIRLSPSSFFLHKKQLENLYTKVFDHYPYDVLNLMERSSENNLFLACIGEGLGGEQIIGCLGVETASLGGITVGEIGGGAVQPGCRGFSAVLHRYLMQWLVQYYQVPDLLFSETRISRRGLSLKANRFAGRELHPETILPWHTAIASSIDPGEYIALNGSRNIPFYAENMTVTSLTRAQTIDTLKRLGEIPLPFSTA